VNIGQPSNWGELISNVQIALNNISTFLTEFSSRTERYKDQDGRLVLGGLGDGAVVGKNLAPAVVDELQRIGDAIGGGFTSKTDEEWKNLHRN
jgi:hypothetical protein